MPVEPPEDQQKKLNAAASGLVAALRSLTWAEAQVTFELKGDRIVLVGFDVKTIDTVALARLDIVSLLEPVGDALTALWRRAGPEPWLSGKLVITRGKNPFDIDATVELN